MVSDGTLYRWTWQCERLRGVWAATTATRWTQSGFLVFRRRRTLPFCYRLSRTGTLAWRNGADVRGIPHRRWMGDVAVVGFLTHTCSPVCRRRVCSLTQSLRQPYMNSRHRYYSYYTCRSGLVWECFAEQRADRTKLCPRPRDRGPIRLLMRLCSSVCCSIGNDELCALRDDPLKAMQSTSSTELQPILSRLPNRRIVCEHAYHRSGDLPRPYVLCCWKRDTACGGDEFRAQQEPQGEGHWRIHIARTRVSAETAFIDV